MDEPILPKNTFTPEQLLKQIEDTQSFLLGYSWAGSGRNFFELLAEYLYNTLHVDYVCIDKLMPGELEAQTLAVYFDGNFEDNVRYTLDDTPCGKVSGQQVCCFPHKVRYLFPNDTVLQEMIAESYAGITLWSSEGVQIGLIAVISRKPLTDTKLTEIVLKQVSIRAASELEHNFAEETLRKNQENQKAIIESAMDGFWLTDLKGNFLDVNDAYCSMSGYSREELLKMKISDVDSIESDEETLMRIKKIINQGKDRFESVHKRKDGSYFIVEINVKYRNLVGGQLVTFLHDITKRKNSEKFLRESEERYKSIFRESMSVMMLINPDTAEIIDVNQAACNFYGWSHEEMIQKKITDINILPQEKTIFNLNQTKALKNNHLFFKHKLANGEIRDVEVYSNTILFGNTTNIYSIIHDITERTQLEEALRESEYFFKESQRAASIGSYKTDFVNNCWESSEVLDQIFGITNDYNKSLEGWLDLIHPDDKDVMTQYILDEVLSKGSEFNCEYRIVRKSDGEVRWVLGLGDVNFDDQNNVISLVGTIQDITERKEREEALRLSEQRLEALFNSVNETILLVDIEGKVLMGNHTAASRWGLTVDQIIGYNVFSYSDPATKAKRDSQVREMIETRLPLQFEEPFNDKIFDLTFYPIIQPTGQINQFVIIHRDITKQKTAEKTIRESEALLTGILNSVNDSGWLFSKDGKILMANKIASSRLNLPIEEIIGKKFADFIPNELAVSRMKKLVQVFETGDSHNFEDIRNGICFEHTFYPVFDYTGNIESVVSFSRDITEKKEFENKLRQSEEKFRNLVWDMQVGVLLQGPKAEILISNPKALELLGLTEDQLLGKTSFDPDWNVIHEDGSPFPGETHPVSRVIATLKPVQNVVMGVYNPSINERLWLLVHAVPQIGTDGNLQQVVCTFIDISELKNAEKALKESELRLKYHFENSPLAVVEWDNDFVVKQWSAEAERMFGWEKTETLGKPIGDLNLIYEEDLPIVNHTMQRLTNGEEDTVVSSNRNVTKSGSIITTVWYNSVLFDENRKMSSVVSLVQDITIQKKAEELLLNLNEELDKGIKKRTDELERSNERLKIAEEKYRTVADFTYNMETWMDLNGKYIYVSPSCYNITGYTAEEFMDDPALFSKIAHPDDREMVENHFKEDMIGTVLKGSLEFRIIAKSGVERWIGHSCQQVYNAEGKLLGQRGSNRNITRQKKAEQILIESEKNLRLLTQRMDELAEEERIRISREIHDEIGHLLTALKYDTEGLINHPDRSSKQVNEDLTDMISLIDLLIDSVRKIATELRPGILDHMGLLAAIEWKIKQFRMKNKICCEYQVDEMDMQFTKNETTFIYRILQEIFTNVTRHSKATYMWISITYKDGCFLMKVTDNGVGFDVQKGLQKGSLGLLGMRERAKSIGGEIQIESEPGKGTITIFTLKK